MNFQKLSLLSDGQIWGSSSVPQLDVLKKYGTKTTITDLCILTGGYFREDAHCAKKEAKSILDNRTCWYWIDYSKRFAIANFWGEKAFGDPHSIHGAIRPVLQSLDALSQISGNRIIGKNGAEEVEYGEYPQTVASIEMQKKLEFKYKRNELYSEIKKSYTFNTINMIEEHGEYHYRFQLENYKVYQYDWKQYIRMKAVFNWENNFEKVILSNGAECKLGDYVWVEVLPVRWLIDDKTGLLIAKKGLVSGLPFWRSNGLDTDVEKYLDKIMLKDLTQSVVFSRTKKVASGEYKLIEKNEDCLSFGELSQEKMIRGAVESGIPVFLHGYSSTAKILNVKKIDPTCEIVYLPNVSQESLNGKSVYNELTGEMINIPPTWFKKLQEKCEKEPNRFHIVYFDEISNSSQNIQKILFDIVSTRQINEVWNLPDNAQIVVAANDDKELSISKYLFNVFAHIHVKTTIEDWLKLAIKNNIHPAICSYVALENDKAAFPDFRGFSDDIVMSEKWILASKMLYATNNPRMLSALLGKDLTNQFTYFCSNLAITLDDVINENYNDIQLQSLLIGEKYATIMQLIKVDENNLAKVRKFVERLGENMVTVFDVLWTRDDENRIKILEELKFTTVPKKSLQRK